MRVLVTVHGFPPDSSTGAEKVAALHARNLLRDGHQVEVLTLDTLNSQVPRLERRDEQGVTVHRLSYDLGMPGPALEQTYEHPAVADAFRSVLDAGSFDIVHVVSGYLLGGQVIEIARQRRIPVVVTLTEFWFMCPRLNLLHRNGQLCSGPESAAKCAWCLMKERRRYRIPARVAPHVTERLWTAAREWQVVQPRVNATRTRQDRLRAALEQADLVIAPSNFLISMFESYGYDTSRFVCVRHGLERPARVSCRRSSGQDGVLRLGYVGQVSPHKGVDLIVEAVMSLVDRGRPVELEIWGPLEASDSYTATMMRRSRGYEEIRWYGGFGGSKEWEVLARLDSLVVPSRWYENSPLVILESFAAGVPVVATRLGGMRELVDDERNGLLFNLNDAVDLERQIERLINDPGLLPRLRAGIPPVRTAREETREICSLYSRLLPVVLASSGRGD